jgi:hypothetical protein
MEIEGAVEEAGFLKVFGVRVGRSGERAGPNGRQRRCDQKANRQSSREGVHTFSHHTASTSHVLVFKAASV